MVVIGVVDGLNEQNRVKGQMEPRGQVWTLCDSSMHSNHSKLIEITAGELSVKSQLTRHHSNKAISTEWCQSSTCDFDRVRRATGKTVLPFWKEAQSGI